jgi:hypothetical protein
MARIAAVLLVTAGCWGVWIAAGMVLAWAGLDDLDVPARVAAEFAFLSACEAALAWLDRARSGPG